MLLEPLYEQDFLDCSHGFRPERSPHTALETLWEQTMRQGGGWVIDLDIRKFFDTLSHSLLRTILGQRMRDGVITRLIGKWLKAGVMENGAVSHAGQGTPQGGVLSPLLSNIYLARSTRPVVHRGNATAPAGTGIPGTVRRRRGNGIHRSARFRADVECSAEAICEVRADRSRREDRDAEVRTTGRGKGGSTTGEFSVPGVHPLLGTLAQGEMDREAAHRERSAYPRATRCISLVQAQPACAAPGTASGPAEQAVRPLRVLRHHG